MFELFRKLNIDLTNEQSEKFEKYMSLLLLWNEKMNLTAITERNEVIVKHFLDSITPVLFRDFKDKKIIDIGTGAGFPGVPIKIMCESCNICLADSLNKRVTFLNEVKNILEFKNTEILHTRAEELGQDMQYRQQFDFAVSRAVAKLSVLSEYTLPFVKVSGEVVALKGPKAYEEIEESENAIKTLGGRIKEVKSVKLPGDIEHYLVFIEKIKPTPNQYPRPQGKMNKKPL